MIRRNRVVRAERIMRRTGKPHITTVFGDLEACYWPGVDRALWVKAEKWCLSKRERIPGPPPVPRVPWHREVA